MGEGRPEELGPKALEAARRTAALSGRIWRELQRRGAACGFTEMAAGGDLREKRAPGPGHSLGTKAEAAFGGRGRRFWGKLAGGGRRGGTKLPGRAALSKNSTNGWCFLEAVLERKGRIGHRGVVKSEAVVKGYFFREGFFFRGL